MPDFETKDEITEAFGSLERLLTEEVAFWRKYIEHCKFYGNGSVPHRSFDALKLAEEKLLRLQTTQDNGNDAKRHVH